jgi:hypothetical protein
MAGMEEFEFTGASRGPNPATRAAYRRQVWLEIYLPFAVGLVALVAVAVLLWRGGAGASPWADASLIMLLLPLLALSVLPIMLLAAAVYGLGVLIDRLPGPAHQAQAAVAQVARSTKRAAGASVRPFFETYPLVAAARRGVEVLLSIVGRDKAEA